MAAHASESLTATTESTNNDAVARRPEANDVHALVARSGGDPQAIASLLRAHPGARHAIVTVLQQTFGNTFVRTVTELLSSPTTPGNTATGPMRVKVDGLNVRRSANIAPDNILGMLQRHEVVESSGAVGEWVKIEFHGTSAFVFGHYLEPATPKPKAEHPPAPAATPVAHADAPAHAAEQPHVQPHVQPQPQPTPVASTPAPAPAPAHVEPAHVEPAHVEPAHVEPAHQTPAPQIAASPKPESPPPAHHDTPAHGVDGHVATDTQVAAHKESDQAAGKPAADKKKKAKPSGYSRSAGETTRAALTRLANAGKIKITPSQIAQLDGASQVESGGKIGSVDTTDDQVVSIGFFQIVLGHKSIEAVMQKVPGAFAKYGLELDPSKTYAFASNPHQIKGVEDYDELRSHEWGDKFLRASLDDEIIAASTELVLKEAGHVEQITAKQGGTGDYFKDDTARAWLLELHNNRPAYVPWAVKTAVDRGAVNAKDREHFLDILATAIEDSYIPEGVRTYQHIKAAAKKPLSADDDKKLLAESKQNARLKGTHIVQKISRQLVLPTLDPAVAKTDDHDHAPSAHVATATPAEHAPEHAATPAPTPAAAEPAQGHQASRAHVETRSTEHAHAPAPQHQPDAKAPAQDQPHAAQAPQPEHDALDGEYALILGQVKSGLMGIEQGASQLTEFDKVMHAGSPSVKGEQLVAKLHSEMAAQRPAATHDAARTAAKPETAAAPPAKEAPAADAKPLPKVELAGTSQKLIDDVRALKTDSSAHVAEVLEKMDTEVSLLSKHLDEKEYTKTKDTNRDKLVATIGELRLALTALNAPAVAPDALAALKTRVYLHIQDLSPYYSQFRNVDILEQFTAGDTNTRTCNITSLSMALESLGATPGTYDAKRMPIVQRVAGYFMDEKNRAAGVMKKDGTHAKAGEGKGLADADIHLGTGLTTLRMPDFVELAAIAEHCTETSSDAEINEARWKAWDEILSIFKLETIAKRFHVGTETAALKVGGKNVGNDLFNFGGIKTGKGEYDNNRMNTEYLVDARNTLEQLKAAGKSETDKEYKQAKTKYDTLLAKDKDALDGKGAKNAAAPELDAYKQAVLEQVGKPFEQGKAVVIALYGHFTRLQGIDDKELTIGDPAKWTTGQHRKVLWEEARAMGYFHHFLLLG